MATQTEYLKEIIRNSLAGLRDLEEISQQDLKEITADIEERIKTRSREFAQLKQEEMIAEARATANEMEEEKRRTMAFPGLKPSHPQTARFQPEDTAPVLMEQIKKL